MKKVIKDIGKLTNAQRNAVNTLAKSGWQLITLNGYIHFPDETGAVELQDAERRSILVHTDGSYRLPRIN